MLFNEKLFWWVMHWQCDIIMKQQIELRKETLVEI